MRAEAIQTHHTGTERITGCLLVPARSQFRSTADAEPSRVNSHIRLCRSHTPFLLSQTTTDTSLYLTAKIGIRCCTSGRATGFHLLLMKGLVTAVKCDDATASRRLTVTVWLWQDPSWTSAFDLGSDFSAMCYTPRAPLASLMVKKCCLRPRAEVL